MLGHLGLALHASQDFYSHSNWTDETPTVADGIKHPPGLGKTKPAPWINKRGVSFPDGLLTGCFEGVPESRHCKGRVRHDDLNKDKGSISVANGTVGQGNTPRAKGNSNFKRAVNVAVLDSKSKWQTFRNGLVRKYGKTKAERMICALTRDNPTKTCR